MQAVHAAMRLRRNGDCAPNFVSLSAHKKLCMTRIPRDERGGNLVHYQG
jgi:hypothetical protein